MRLLQSPNPKKKGVRGLPGGARGEPRSRRSRELLPATPGEKRARASAEQLRQMRERFNKLFAAATGQTPERIAADTARDFWLNTDEALAYGLLGKVISSADDLK